MSNWRWTVEKRFESFARLFVRHPWATLAITLIPVVLLASQLPQVRFDTSTEGFLHPGDPVMQDYYAFRDQFGRDELILLALQPPRIFDLGFLEKLRVLHERLENEVPYLEEVTSLINARATRGAEGELIVEDLLEDWPENPAELARVEAFALSNASYRNLLLSEDGRFTTVAIRTSSISSAAGEGLDDFESGFGDETPGAADDVGTAYLTDEENSEVVAAVQTIVAEESAKGLDILVAGSPVVTDAIKSSMQADMLRFVRLTVAIIGVLLFLLFRRASAVVLPLVVVVLSLLSTIGLMTFAGAALKLPTMILPAFLLAVGVGDSVHILTIFYRRFDAGDSREDAISYALGHSGLAVLLTSLTTAGGLLSFAPTALAPIADLGKFAPAGVMIALVLSLVLLPALLAVVPLRRRKPSVETDSERSTLVDRIVTGCGDFASGRPRTVVTASVLLLVVGLCFALRVDFRHNPLEWLPDEMPVRAATVAIDRELRGSITMEVIIDLDEENGWYEPAALAQLEWASTFAEAYSDDQVFIGRAFSLADVLKETHRALNENRADYYRLPEERALIAQELFLFENTGSDDLEDVVDPQFSKVRLTLKAPWVDANAYGTSLDLFTREFAERFGTDARVVITGMMPLLFRTMSAVMISMVQSYLIAFVVITCLMVLLIGDVRLGLVSMFPNLLPIVLTLGVMGALGMPLDVFTLLIGSIALGLAVDDTIHFMHNYRRYHEEGADSRRAIHQTLNSTGRAMLFTTLTLSTGFLVFTQASMNNIANFGLLTSFAIFMALLADFLLAPALVQLMHGRRT